MKLTIGQRIQKCRKSKGLTLPKLAEISGVSKGALSKIENKPSNVCFNTLEKIASGLDLTVAELIQEK